MGNALSRVHLLARTGAAASGSLAPYGPGGSMGFGVGSWTSGSSYDYHREAGLRYDNSIVYTNLAFLSRKQSEATMRLEQKDAATKWAPARLDPISVLFRRPNKFYGESILWFGLLLSWFTAGDAYLYKVRSTNTNQPTGLWYIPHFQIRPRADRYNDDGQKLVSYYEYTPIGGVPIELPVEDIIHVRAGMDPLRPGCGLAPMRAVLREICADNEAATYCAAMLRNMGVPGVILSPKPLKDGTGWSPATPDQRNEMRDLWDGFRRDARGGVLPLPMPLDIVAPSFDPQKMLMNELRNDCAARICAAFGMDPMVHGLQSSSKTYSNYEEALAAALHNCFLPTMRDIASQAFDGLRADFPSFKDDSYRLGWDFSEVRGLQEDIDALHERYREDYKAGGIDRWTFKTRIGEMPEETDKGVYATTGPAAGESIDPAATKAEEVKAIKARARERRRELERA